MRYFVEVAERLNFRRAALALHINQPALSRQIQQLERDIGVKLLNRSSREVALTPAGEQFLHHSRQLLTFARTALDSARRVAGGDDTLRIGFMLGVDTEATLQAFSARSPDVSMLLQRLRWWNQGEAVRDGRVDTGFVRLPIDSQGLELLPLYSEPIRVALPSNHPLAGNAELGIAEVADEPVLRYTDAIAAWNAFWCIDPRPDGTQARPGPFIHDMEEIVEYVRRGRSVAFLPESVSTMFPRPGITYVPVIDIPPSQVALAWAAGRHAAPIEVLAHAAQQNMGNNLPG